MKIRILAVLLVLSIGAFCQVPVVLSPLPQLQFFDQSGRPLAFGCVFSYASGTTTPLDTYTDFTGVTKNKNPVILSAGGSANIWLLAGQTYSLKVESSGGINCFSGAMQYTINGIGGGASTLTTVVPWSPTPTFTDISQNQLFEITLAANTAALPLAVVGVIPPGNITFEITQDGAGGHTFAWPSNTVGGCSIGLNANQVTTQMFVWNGTTANAVGPCVTGNGPSVSTGDITAGNISATGLTINGLAPDLIVCKNTTPMIHTGDTTVDTVFTCPLPILSATSIVRLTLSWNPTLQGASGTTVFVKLGGSMISQAEFNNSPGYSGVVTIVNIANLGSVSSQIADTIQNYNQNETSGQIVTFVGDNSTVNTGVSVNLVVQAQNGTNTDSQTFNYVLVELL